MIWLQLPPPIGCLSRLLPLHREKKDKERGWEGSAAVFVDRVGGWLAGANSNEDAISLGSSQ